MQSELMQAAVTQYSNIFASQKREATKTELSKTPPMTSTKMSFTDGAAQKGDGAGLQRIIDSGRSRFHGRLVAWKP